MIMKNISAKVESLNVLDVKNQVISLLYTILRFQFVCIAFENMILKNARNIKN